MQSPLQDTGIWPPIPHRQRVVLVVTPPAWLGGPALSPLAMQLNAAIAAAQGQFRFVQIPQPDGFKQIPIKQAVENADIVWLHDTLSLNSYAAFRAARERHKTLLVTQHNSPASFVASKLDRVVTQKILSAAHQVIFSNDNVASYYSDRVMFPAPAKIISNGIDLQTFQMTLPEKRNVLRARFALRREQPVLLFGGAFDNLCGLSVIRHLAHLLPSWRFWLAGDGPLRPEKWFLPNVQTFRNRRGDALAELYQAADLFIAPGCGKQSTTPLQQALACGLPVLCSPDIAASNRIIKPKLAIADMVPHSAQHTAQLWAMKLNLMRNRNDFPLVAANGELAGLAEGLWGWRQIADGYASILNDLVYKTLSR